MGLKCSVGGRDSDSFVTVDQADEYMVIGPDDHTDWFGLSIVERELRLQLAAQVIGILPCKGRTVYCGQALAFPRSCQDSPTFIPEDVKVAQAWIAYSVVHRGLEQRPTEVSENAEVGNPSQISLGGLVMVSFRGKPTSGGDLMTAFVRSGQFHIFSKLKRWVSQVRGGSVKSTDDADYPECSTTTTTTTTSTFTTTTT